MSAEGSLPSTGDASVTNEEVELARVLESYLAHLEAGRPADPEGLIATHPELARPLRACLKVMHLAQGLDQSEQSHVGPREVDPEAFEPMRPMDSTALTAVWPGDGRPPQVFLPEPPDDDSPILRMHSQDRLVSLGVDAGRYQILGEIARGGMGIVLKARDADLGRDLALKVLLDRHRGDQDVVRRFVEEAQIGGQLQHPGIVPVHELGALADRKPFFAMMLVKGRTLAALLAERPSATANLPRFLAILESICQTVAYAHARRVIHRDLKPGNVMVGNFGEVQVMDWGLAKVLAAGGVADEAKALRIAETAVSTVRSGSAGSGSESQAGSVLGTPAYMAPEQARGDIEQIDERADVFGLGAILCEILTGRPPYVGSTREEIRDKAARGDLTDGLGRLAASGADAELVSLARDCLAPERTQRPRNAGEVSRRLMAYLAGVQERLKAAELARVEAQTRAEEAHTRATIERSRRLRTVALAGSILITVGVVGGGWAHLARQRLEREAAFNQALGEADGLCSEAKHAGDDTARWFAARDATHALERLLPDAPDESSRARASGVVRDVTRAVAAAENDQRLLAKLVDIRIAKSDAPDASATDADYADAFREAGIDIASSPPAEAGAMIAARPRVVRVSLATAIDDWSAVRRGSQHGRDGAFRLTEVARLADPDPWRNRLRDFLQTSANQDRLTGLKGLARPESMEMLPAVSFHLLGATILNTGDPADAAAVLRHGQRLHPNDVWLNFTLAQCLGRLGRREEAIRYYVAARSLRPETAHELGHALEEKGETDEAINVFQDLTRMRPSVSRHLVCLGNILKSRGRTEEANTALDAALARFRAAMRAKPDTPEAHINLGVALHGQERLNEAIAEYREALQIKPDSLEARFQLGRALNDQGEFNQAITEYREALRIHPGAYKAHDNLALALHGQGRLNEAITELREALRLKPDNLNSHNNLGIALKEQGKLFEAITEYREALRLKPDLMKAHNNLGLALKDQGKLVEAVVELREAVRLKPDDHNAHDNLGTALRDQGRLVEAIAESREAVRLKPDDHNAHDNLGIALRDQGRLVEAIAEFREAVRLEPDDHNAHNNLGLALRHQGNLDLAAAEFRTALRLSPKLVAAHSNLVGALAMQGKLDETIAAHRQALRFGPDDASVRNNLGLSLAEQGKYGAAIAEYREALRLKPDDFDAHANLGLALIAQGKPGEAIVALREAVRLKPDLVRAHYNLGKLLGGQGSFELAIAAYREALRYKPEYAEAHCNLGHMLRQEGRFVEALVELKRGHEIGSKNSSWRYPSAEWVHQAERLVELDSKLPAMASGQDKPADAAESLTLAQMCYNKKLREASARLWVEAFRAQPKFAADMKVQNRYNAACAAALACSGQGKHDPPLDDAAKAKWRKQALDWLKDDLAAWSKMLEASPPQRGEAIAQTLQHWKADADLGGLRDEPELAKLPADEQKACRALWDEVDALLAKVQGNKPASGL
jgi:eukaryotic-like serine/threonine-protein kinase